MKKNFIIEGVVYRLRPVTLGDANFIIKLRLEDLSRTKYINPISDNLELQEMWISEYLKKEDDYYFVIENIFTNKAEGLIGIYNIEDCKAEWGRWVISKSSMSALESVDLIYQVAFNKLGLNELYCRTIVDNVSVVAFHDNLPQKRRKILEKYVSINDVLYDVIEHYVDKSYYQNDLRFQLEPKSDLALTRSLRLLLGKMEFHHIGVATKDIEREFSTYRLLGYKREGNYFTDEIQGIKGQFIVSNNQPRLELLENLVGSNTLNKWIEDGNKNYHFAYLVDDIESAIVSLGQRRFRVISPLKLSSYFGKRICFLVMPNRFMIELIER
ncbi:GNAT family N-acetyltransferase [Aeromonas veronii]